MNPLSILNGTLEPAPKKYPHAKKKPPAVTYMDVCNRIGRNGSEARIPPYYVDTVGFRLYKNKQRKKKKLSKKNHGSSMSVCHAPVRQTGPSLAPHLALSINNKNNVATTAFELLLLACQQDLSRYVFLQPSSPNVCKASSFHVLIVVSVPDSAGLPSLL